MTPMPTSKPLYPVVLMHGFGAFMHLLSNVSIRPIVAALEQHGLDIFAPMVQPYNTVPERADLWLSHLERIRIETGAARLNLIGYSSGGLDARYLISRLGGHAFVASLSTISTPHRGSSYAGYIIERPAVLRKSITGVADWMGDRLYGSHGSDSLRALKQLTPEYMTRTFNPAVLDHPDVRYFSWAGAAGRGTENPLLPVLRASNRIVFEREGINDGLVSVESSTWTGFKGTIAADHALQIGIRVGKSIFDPAIFLTRLIWHLSRIGL